MKNKLISIIVPIYNCENVLEECLQSIQKQTYKNIEVYMINDGSKDESEKICLKYSKNDKRFKYIFKENSGVSDTRNVGILKSSGEYIMFVDSDDVLEDNIIETLIDNYNKNTLVICDRFFFKESEDIKNIKPSNEYKKEIFEYENYIDLYEKHLINPPFARIYSKQILTDNNIFFESGLNLGEDLLFNLKYIKFVKNITFIDSKKYYYRVGNSSTLSNKYFDNMLEIQLNLLNKFSAFFKDTSNVKIEKSKIDFINIIILNEFHKKSFVLKRYFSARKAMSNSLLKREVFEIYKRKGISKFQYYLLKNNLIFTYLILRKIKKVFG